jgi:hypothetical protein
MSGEDAAQVAVNYHSILSAIPVVGHGVVADVKLPLALGKRNRSAKSVNSRGQAPVVSIVEV